MADRIKRVIAGMFVVSMAGSMLWWGICKYHDCKRVGHSALYCVMDIGK